MLKLEKNSLMSNEMEMVYWPIDRLIEYARNPRKNDHAVDQIAAAIREFGFRVPILAKSDGLVVDGHLRLKAARKLGLETVPVIPADDLTDAQVKAFRISVNRMADLAEWDNELLALELADLKAMDFDLNLTGFNLDDLSSLMAPGEPESLSGQDEADDAGADAIDQADELQKKWQVKLGDLWRLGDHKIICGDCTDPAVIARLMAGEKAHICWTDPPWNVAYGEGLRGGNSALGWKPRTILNDNLGDKFPEFCQQFIARIYENVLPGAPLYMAMSAQEWPVIHEALSAVGFHWSSTIIWAKDSLVVSRKDYHTQYEPIYYAWRGDAARLCPVEDRTQSDLWQIPRPKRSDLHPTTKPIALVERSLQNSSKPGNLVFEPFSGSGTTLMACARTNRVVRACELAEKYVACALERWSELTGGTPVLEK